jgi:hypothetical protein
MKQFLLFIVIIELLTACPHKTLTMDGVRNLNPSSGGGGMRVELPMVVMDTPIRVGPASEFEQIGVLRAGTIVTRQLGCVEYRGALLHGPQIALETWLQIDERAYVLVCDWMRRARITGVCD